MTHAILTPKTATAAALVALALPLGACGSSKPAYCKNKDALQNSIKALPDQLKSGGISAVQAQLKKIESDANTLVSSAKSDFPDQTSAMQSSINGLKTQVKQLPSSPTPQDLLAIAPAATSAVSSVNAFAQAAKNKCD